VARRARRQAAAGALVVAALGFAADTRAAKTITIPLNCQRGPSGQVIRLSVTVPPAATEGSSFAVRFDGVDTGKISHVGLRYIHDMTTEMLIPDGTNLVERSLRIIPGTGSPNVRAGARVTRQGAIIRLVLPAHVEAGERYTPPSFEFLLEVTAAARRKIVHRFSRWEVTANAIILGDLRMTCDANPRPYPVASTTVKPAPP
jgi:hypothetical protein